MAFQLPDDSPLQLLQGQAEAIGRIVLSYYQTLTTGMPEELAGELALQYADGLFNLIYKITPSAITTPPVQ